MSEPVAPPPAPPPPPSAGMGAGRIVLVVLGAIATVAAIGLLAAGGFLLWADQTQRDDDGFFTSSSHGFESGGYALTSEGVDIASDASGEDIPDWLLDEGRLATIRVRATSTAGGDVFVGIGPEDDVLAYLGGVAYDEVTDFDVDPFRVEYRTIDGTAEPAPPGEQTFWAESASGAGEQTVEWPVEQGRWALVVMNADASPGVAVDADFGAKVSFILWLAIALLVGGAIVLAAGVLMLAIGIAGAGGGAAGPPPAGAVGAVPPAPVEETGVDEPYVVSVEGRRDEELNRFLPLVKWLLAIPHVIVLVFLWIAFFVLTIVAGFAILFTERYPRSLFDFNVGVLRWTWRVTFYAYGALGTDRYPPFTLGPADYPATLDVPYPERLSRGLVLVKWWLLAIPHYLVVGVLTGSGSWWWWDKGPGALGLISALALVAAGGLLLFARYPRGVFDLLVGANRWVYRVVAYAGLMRDEYPPFRLGR